MTQNPPEPPQDQDPFDPLATGDLDPGDLPPGELNPPPATELPPPIPEYGAPGTEPHPGPAGGPAEPPGPVFDSAPGSAHATEPGAPRPDAKAAWSDAGDRLSGLGSKLRSHYEQQAETTGAGSAEVKDAAKKLGEAVQSAFEAIGTAAKDPAVKDDVRQVGRSVSDALAGTFAGLSDEFRKTFGKDSKGPGTDK